MTDTLRLSPSKMDTYARCGIQFENRYLLGKREPPGVAMLVGRSMDEAVSQSLVKLAETGTLSTMEEVATVAGEAATREFAEVGSELALDSDELKAGLKRVRDRAKDRSVRMALAHRKLVAPWIRPEMDWKTGKPRIQHSWEIEMPNDVVLAGRSDVEEVDNGVRDTKTSMKPKPEAWADTSLQLTAYGLARRAIDGHKVVPVKFDVIVDRSPNLDVKGTDPAGVRWQLLQSERTEWDFFSYMARVDHVAKSIRAGVFIPARPDDWICSKKFCGYWSKCPHAARPRQFAVAAPEGIEKEDTYGDD